MVQKIENVRGLFDDRAVKRFENDSDEILTLGAFDLLEGLDVVVLGAVHDGENFGDEMGFTAGPLTGGTNIGRFHCVLSVAS